MTVTEITVASAVDTSAHDISATDTSAQDMYVQSLSEGVAGPDDAVNHILSAIQNDEFRLYCQPITPLSTLAAQGGHYEVLICLHEEEEDMMPPGAFFPLVEKYGLMPHLDRWVVQHVIKWLSLRPPPAPLRNGSGSAFLSILPPHRSAIGSSRSLFATCCINTRFLPGSCALKSPKSICSCYTMKSFCSRKKCVIAAARSPSAILAGEVCRSNRSTISARIFSRSTAASFWISCAILPIRRKSPPFPEWQKPSASKPLPKWSKAMPAWRNCPRSVSTMPRGSAFLCRRRWMALTEAAVKSCRTHAVATMTVAASKSPEQETPASSTATARPQPSVL
ncbi:protein of unknown function [Georgfuchsia toluolica]|uniref:EAL domain-containing protein n=1 Tax=Georgfuchsia toluolica TaxID=424218 RepID=A0A916J2W1_9PROT|nr:protein of unknown function [Georgfuchsia toluolica]